jgi:BMFP domain-containing protein YqiC
MKPDQLFEQFTQQFNKLLGPAANAAGDEVKQQIRAAMMGAFDKLELVTRDEFDAQRAVLLRTRERLETLEKQVAEIEINLTK